MDRFSIERGTLPDRPRVRTLEEPYSHSFHSLFDVRTCVNSGFEILLDPVTPEDLYTRGARFDKDGTDMLIAVGRFYKNTSASKTGFRVTVRGTLQDLGSEKAPPTIQLKEIDELARRCSSDDANIVDIKEILTELTFPVSVTTGMTAYTRAAVIHGSLMLIGWGWLIPSGTIIAKFFKVENPMWLRIHQSCQILGLLLSISGLVIALINFDSFGQKGLTAYYHAIIGITVMTLGTAQAIVAAQRPRLPEAYGEEKSTARIIWEYSHKVLGWTSLPLAFITIGLGTTLLPLMNQITFQVVYLVVLCLIAIVLSQTKKVYMQVANEDSPGISLSTFKNIEEPNNK